MGTLAEMLSTPRGVIEWFVYLLAAVMFVIGLHLMNSPKTARKGNMVSAIGMVFAVAMAFIVLSAPLCHFRVCGAFGGGAAGSHPPVYCLVPADQSQPMSFTKLHSSLQP